MGSGGERPERARRNLGGTTGGRRPTACRKTARQPWPRHAGTRHGACRRAAPGWPLSRSRATPLESRNDGRRGPSRARSSPRRAWRQLRALAGGETTARARSLASAPAKASVLLLLLLLPSCRCPPSPPSPIPIPHRHHPAVKPVVSARVSASVVSQSVASVAHLLAPRHHGHATAAAPPHGRAATAAMRHPQLRARHRPHALPLIALPPVVLDSAAHRCCMYPPVSKLAVLSAHHGAPLQPTNNCQPSGAPVGNGRQNASWPAARAELSMHGVRACVVAGLASSPNPSAVHPDILSIAMVAAQTVVRRPSWRRADLRVSRPAESFSRLISERGTSRVSQCFRRIETSGNAMLVLVHTHALKTGTDRR